MELRNQKDQLIAPPIKRALLMEALSYIQDFQDQIVVIKYGGAAMIEEDLKNSFAQDVVLLQSLGMRPVIVHGGGPEVSKAIKQFGHESSFIDGLRVTDHQSMKISEMVLSGLVNKDIVTQINIHGGLGIGLSGKDGKLIEAKKLKHPTADLGFVGEVEKVNPTLIFSLAEQGYIPVISPIGMGVDHHSYNINADTAASHMASALNAQKIIFLTDVPGILMEDQVISSLTPEEAVELIASEVIAGGMKPKVEGMLQALSKGVNSAHIINGTDKHTLISELFTDKGTGTMISSPPVEEIEI